MLVDFFCLKKNRDKTRPVDFNVTIFATGREKILEGMEPEEDERFGDKVGKPEVF